MVSNDLRNHSGDSFTSTPSIVTPQKRGQSMGFSMTNSIGKLLFCTLKFSIEGNVISRPVLAFISRATPQCEAASARLGVNPISINKSASKLKYCAAGVPFGSSVFNTKIPS